MCSLVESRPFHMITHGTGCRPCCALEKYAGSMVPSNGTSTRVVAGSASSKTFSNGVQRLLVELAAARGRCC